MNLEERMLKSIRMRQGNVVLRREVSSLGSPSQVTEALQHLVTRKVLVRIGKGVYAKTRISSVTDELVPAGSLETLAMETLKKLGVEPMPGRAARAYNTGKTTQLPGAFVVNTGARRISRRLMVGGRQLAYENDFSRAA